MIMKIASQLRWHTLVNSGGVMRFLSLEWPRGFTAIGFWTRGQCQAGS